MIDQCRLLRLPLLSDSRGSLSFVEGGRHVPFEIKRIYYLYDVPSASTRGGHAHKALHQLMIAISGSFWISVSDGRGGSREFHLSTPDQGLYICPMIWRELDRFSTGAVCLVLASEYYDDADYFRRHDDYVQAVRTSP